MEHIERGLVRRRDFDIQSLLELGFDLETLRNRKTCLLENDGKIR